MENLTSTKLQTQLNNLGLSHTFSNTSGIVEFYCGNYVLGLEKFIKKYAPFSKIALASSNLSFEHYGKKIIDAIKSFDSKVISLVLEEQTQNTIESFSQLFDFPEDVRLIVVMDQKLYSYAFYYANIKNIPVVILPIDYNVEGLFDTNVDLLINGKIDSIQLMVNKSIILDTSFPINYYDLFLSFYSNYANYFDNLITESFLGIKSRKSYEDFHQCISNFLDLNFANIENNKEDFIYNIILIQLQYSKLFRSSSSKIVNLIAKIMGENNGETKLQIFNFLIHLFYSIKDYKEIIKELDYKDIALLCKNYKLNMGYVLDSNVNFLEIFEKNFNNISKVVELLNERTNNLIEINSKFIEASKALTSNTNKSVKNFEKIKKSVSLASIYPKNFNSLTLLKCLGIIDNV